MGAGWRVVVALLLAFGAGCGGTEKAEPPEPDFTDAAALVEAMRTAWNEAGSVSWRVRGEDLHDWGWAETGAGRQQRIWGTATSIVQADGTTRRTQGPRALRTDQIACQTTPETGTRERFWACTYDERLFDLVVKLEYARENPTRWIPALQDPQGLEDLGETTVVVPTGLDDATPLAMPARHFRFDAVTAPDLPARQVEVWLDAQDRPLRIRLMDPPQTPALRTTATFFGYGSTVDLTAPPRAVMKDWLSVHQASTGPRVRACMQGYCPPLEIGPPRRH